MSAQREKKSEDPVNTHFTEKLKDAGSTMPVLLLVSSLGYKATRQSQRVSSDIPLMNFGN